MESEPTTLKLLEHSFYIGTVMGAIIYGINLTVYFMIVQILFETRHSAGSISKRRFHAVYSTAMILLVTVCLATNSSWGENMWITSRDKPGGVLLFLATKTELWYRIMGSASTFIMALFAELFLIYRLHIIYASSYLVIVLPLATSLAAFALAILQLVMEAEQRNFLVDEKLVNLGTAYYSLSLSVNAIVTLLITYRLHQLRKEITGALGGESARIYSNISAIIVESAAPYTITTIAWIIPYARGNSTSVVFGLLSGEFSCLAPLMIILRVLNQKAWNKDIVSQVQTGKMQFKAATRSAKATPEHCDLYVSAREAKGDPQLNEPMKFSRASPGSRSEV